MKKNIKFYCLVVFVFFSCSKLEQLEGGGTTKPAAESTATYYVDADNGNDTNAGTSATSAWKTVAKVNATTFKPGNSILLKTGCIWNDQLYPKGSGSATSPIRISSYGTGAKPMIFLSGTIGAPVYLFNQSNWIIENLEVSNYSVTRGTVFRQGIFIQNTGGGVTSNITIRNNYVHAVSGSFRYAGFDPHAFGGIAVVTTGTVGTDRFDKITIEGNIVEDAGRTGIVVWDNVWEASGNASTNVQILNNSVKDIDSDGILVFGCEGALIDHNVANNCGRYREDGQFNGAAAIWPTRGRNCITQFNEAFNTQALDGNGDGQGFDLDIDSYNFVMQYNYSHDNAGGFMLILDASNSINSIIRYNISQNDHRTIFTFAGGITPGTSIYNNTVYIKSGLNTNIIDHSWDDGGGKGDLNQAYYFKNNIIYNQGSGNYIIPGIFGVFDYNIFYGNHPSGEPADSNKLTTDPLLVSQGSGLNGINTVNGYRLSIGSPALNSGAIIPDNGGKDYYGNQVSSTTFPNRGAYNGTGL
ncbi:right-handed parallel beta-helix repeat-containing protein [Pedobacter cryoconitis]|uniref:Right handed beta helix domain-containing protein n=1 Tax=Pedobacter cryoconitis TaxID=188932 RepID=A0A7X0J1R8_9SPHI|nr:right-handed parallel beta-helix repeat-containing protein [Pedobacter cryoconitis]MBB6498862.1 hypothetical protein [Pedobacter cryoconitis]